MKCPDNNGFFFIGGQSIKAQNTTLVDMLVQSISHVKQKVTKMPSFNSDKSKLVLWQILMKISRKLSSYLDKVEYWIY